MKSFVALSAAALFASSVAAHGPTGQRQSLHRRGVERLHRRAKPAVETRSTESTDAVETTAIWWAEDGWVGACGSTIDNDKPQVGLPLSIYTDADAKSSLCGTKAYATNPATGASVTVTVVDGSDRDAFTTFSKSAYLALGGDADVGMLPIKLSLSKEANSAVLAAAAAVVDDDKTSSTKDSSSSSKAVVAASSSSKDAESSVAATSAPAKTTAAPVASTTVAPTSSFDSESAAAAAAASSKASAKAYQSEQAAILAASQASAAAESSQAAAAAASSQAAAEAAASSSAAAAAAASSQAAEQAAASAAAASSSKAAAAAASASAAAAAAEKEKENSSSASSGGHVYSGGYATYYTQNGVAGNCGDVNPDSAYIVALPTATYAGGSHCGQKVRLTRTSTGKTITAMVADSCPTCVNNSCLDLSVAAFTAIATEEEGMVEITWEFI